VVESFVNFGADVTAPGVILRGNRGTFVVGEIDGSITRRIKRLAADIADAEVTGNVLGYLWAKQAYGAMLFATAVTDLSIADVLGNPAYREILLALAREALSQAPVQPMPFDGFDPADLPGSLTRLTEFNRRSAKSHSGVYRDLAVRHRPTEVRAILGPMEGPLIRRVAELITAIEDGRRTCTAANLDLLAAYERLERLGRPLNAVVTVLGDPDRAADGPLASEPVGVKDIIAVAGVTAHCGSPVYDPAPAAQDAELVRRLRAAGAEVFATTQCLEYAAGVREPGGGRHPQPARSVPHLGRVVRRFCGAGRGGRVRSGDRHGHRRVDPDPGGLLRHHRAQADVRAGPGRRGVPALAVLRPRGHTDRVAGGVGPAAPGAGRPRPGRRAGGVAARPDPGGPGADRAAVRRVGDTGGARRGDRRAGGAGRGGLGRAGAPRTVAG
jgi:hypothetical protein